MALQNRVDPFGSVHAVPARGLFTGNRGVIHDPATRTLLSRRWTTKAWIICACDFKDRHREVMGRNARNGGAGWTELFFLDEVTALAAGHRPCFQCRHSSAVRFAEAFASGTGQAKVSAPEMDARLHEERWLSGSTRKAIAPADVAGLPDGTMVARDGQAFALRSGRLLRWSFTGYATPLAVGTDDAPFQIVTPASTIASLADGYQPIWHPSAVS